MLRQRVVRGIEGNDDGVHLWMNVAENVAHPRTIKLHRAASPGFIKPEIESLSFEQRKYIMKKWIPIRELDRRPWRNDEQVRRKSLVLLPEHCMDRRLFQGCSLRSVQRR